MIVEFNLQDLRVARADMRAVWGNSTHWSSGRQQIYDFVFELAARVNELGEPRATYRYAVDASGASNGVVYLGFSWIQTAADKRLAELRGDPTQLKT